MCLPIATGLTVLPEMPDCLPIYIRPAVPIRQQVCAVHRIRHRLSSTISRQWTAAVMDYVPTRETTPYGEQLAPTTLGRARSVFKLCINGTNEAGNDIQVMQCSDGSYCCGGRLYSDIASYCCTGGHGSVWIVDGVPSAKTWYSPTISDPAVSPSVQPPGKITVSEVVSSASQPTRVVASPAKADNNGNRAAKIEGGVLSVFGLALILAACWFVSGRMRKKTRPPPMTNGKHSQGRGNDSIYQAPTYTGDTKRNELAELPVSQAEL